MTLEDRVLEVLTERPLRRLAIFVHLQGDSRALIDDALVALVKQGKVDMREGFYRRTPGPGEWAPAAFTNIVGTATEQVPQNVVALKPARKMTISAALRARLIEQQREKAEEVQMYCNLLANARQDLADIEEIVRAVSEEGAV